MQSTSLNAKCAVLFRGSNNVTKRKAGRFFNCTCKTAPLAFDRAWSRMLASLKIKKPFLFAKLSIAKPSFNDKIITLSIQGKISDATMLETDEIALIQDEISVLMWTTIKVVQEEPPSLEQTNPA